MNVPVDVVGRVSMLLRALSSQKGEGATTTDLARMTSLARPTTHRLLMALLEEGLVDRSHNGCWQLGPEVYLMGAAASRRYDVAKSALPVVRRLALSTGESAFFSTRRGDETVCLVREDGSFPIRSHVLHEGIRLPLGVASAGLAILSFLPDQEIDRYLARWDLGRTQGPEHSADSVRERILRTRESGFALNPGLLVRGNWGLAAAVFDVRGQPQWALSLTGVEQRFSGGRQRELGSLLLDAAHELSALLRQPLPR